MTIRHLKTFIAVCECNGVTRAAERLNVAQPAVSKTISELESYYSVKLFERIDKRLYLTEKGRELLSAAREAAGAFENFEKRAESNGSAPLKMGATLTIGKLYVPRILADMSRLFPSVAVKTVINRASEIERMVLDNSLDFALSEGQSFSEKIAAEPFDEDKLIAVCGVGYMHSDGLDLTALSGCDLLLREKGSASRDMLDGIFAERGISVSPAVQSVSNQALIAAAEENLGVAVLPSKLVRQAIEGGRLKQLKVEGMDFGRKYYFIRHRDKKFSKEQKSALARCIPHV